MSKVSVIVPNYNHELFLERRLESIFNQSFQDFEIIILDDASNDRSSEIIKRYSSHPKVSNVVINEINSGSPFKQWKKGVALARGELIWIAESDDYASEYFLEILVNKFYEFPSIGLAYCQSYQVNKEDHIISPLLWWTNDLDTLRWTKEYLNTGKAECQHYLLYKNTIPNASAVLVRKELLQRALLNMTPMRLAGDWQVWVRILLQTDLFFSNKCLNYFRFHDSTVRNNTVWLQQTNERVEILKLIFSKTRPNDLAIRKIALPIVKTTLGTFIKLEWRTMEELKKIILILWNIFLIDPRVYLHLKGFQIKKGASH